MSQTYFSKLDSSEKESRLAQFALTKGNVTVWVKGEDKKHFLPVAEFTKSRSELILDSKNLLFPVGKEVLCSFEFRGMFFFSKVKMNLNIMGSVMLHFDSILYKSEKRGSYRLLTFPIYEVYVEFDLGEMYQGGKVVQIKNKTNQTGLFKNFLKIVEKDNADELSNSISKHRVQDLSASGLSIHIGELESDHFLKETSFKNIKIVFTDETILVPEAKVMYLVDYITSDKNLKKYKVGIHFVDVPELVDERISGKINKLLREIDFNKDFENLT